MGGSLACEPARLAGEWAGQFGKLARGKRGVDSGQWTMYEADTRQMMLMHCTGKKCCTVQAKKVSYGRKNAPQVSWVFSECPRLKEKIKMNRYRLTQG